MRKMQRTCQEINTFFNTTCAMAGLLRPLQPHEDDYAADCLHWPVWHAVLIIFT